MGPDTLVIRILVGGIVLGALAIGLGTRLGAMGRLIADPGPAVRAMVAMFLVMPMVAIGVGVLFQLAPAGRMALLALALSPLPPLFARRSADLDASQDILVGLQLLAALVSLVAAPLWFLVVGRLVDRTLWFDVERVAFILGMTIAAPLVTGMVVNRAAPVLADAIRIPLERGASVILGGAAVVLVLDLDVKLGTVATPAMFAAVATLFGLGVAAGLVFGAPLRARQRGLGVAMMTRHPGVAITMATTSAIAARDQLFAAVLLAFVTSSAAGVVYRRLTGGKAGA